MLASNGDCVMVTALVRQIKLDNLGCHVTWAIGSKCKQVIINNPFVDCIWEISYDSEKDAWDRVKAEAEAKKRNKEFDEILYCPIFPDYRERFDGTTRSSTFRVYPKPLTGPVTPIIRLFDHEIEKTRFFSLTHGLANYKHVILCECAPSSIQTFLNPELMLNVAGRIVKEKKDVIFIISTHLSLNIRQERIIDASELSYRENAELSKYCTLLVGCSSGITWLLTSDWAKKIPTVQFLNKPNEKPLNFASVKYDFNYYGLDTRHIIESTNDIPAEMATIISDSMDDFKNAKMLYDEELKPNIKMFSLYLKDLFRFRHIAHSFKSCFVFLNNYAHRNKMGLEFYLLFPIFLSGAIIKRLVYEILLYIS